MEVVTVDLETYYDKKYSLKKQAMEEYIRDDRFEIIGGSIKHNNSPAVWYPWPEIDKRLREVDWKNSALLAHNTAFDGAILKWRMGITPKLYLDTLSMARPLHSATSGVSLEALAAWYGLGKKGDEVTAALGKHLPDFTEEELAAYGEYCNTDVELTYKLYKTLMKDFPAKEVLLIDATLRMFIDPKLQLNREALDTHLRNVQQEKEDALASTTATKDQLMSNQQFAAYLTSLGVKPPVKTSPTTGMQTYAFAKTDRGFTELLSHPNAEVRAAAKARLAVKSTLEETRTKSFMEISKRGKLPILLKYYGAHTGRFSGGGGVNLQNLPRGGVLRQAIEAPDGYTLVACDLSQIEARIVAWLAGQKDLLHSFRNGEDVYSQFASILYERTITKADKVERFLGKTCILGLGYGMGAERYYDTVTSGAMGMQVPITMEDAFRAVSLYRRTYGRIRTLWGAADTALTRLKKGSTGMLGPLPYGEEAIQLPNGMAVRYPHLRGVPYSTQYVYCSTSQMYNKYIKGKVLGETETDQYGSWTKIYGAKVVENVVQALARIVVTDAWLRVQKRYPVVLQVHDELVIICPDSEVEEAVEFLEQAMSIAPNWAPNLPVACESAYGKSFGDCK